MIVSIHPSSVSGRIQAPASKSSMQRACAAALVAEGKTVIHNPGHSNDDRAALDIIRRLGAEVKEEEGKIIVESKGVHPVSPEINCGESGLSIRMFTPLVALSGQEVIIKGSGSLVTRPMDFFDEILPQLHVQVKSLNGKLPLSVRGPLKPVNISVDGSLSSQFLTGLLFAYAAACASDVAISVNNLKSKPYIDLTLDVMKQFGLKVPLNRNYEAFYFEPVSDVSRNGSQQYTVEGDWSGGAFLLVAGAIAGNIRVNGLSERSTQADKAILQALHASGAYLKVSENDIEIGPADLRAFDFDATDCPDLFPPLVALASYCKGVTTIKGVSRLAHKESDRGLTLKEEFGKMGITVELDNDTMKVQGGGGLTGAPVHSRHDHRIAMACAVAALKAEGTTSIEDAEAINKSFPDFYDKLETMGGEINRHTLGVTS